MTYNKRFGEVWLCEQRWNVCLLFSLPDPPGPENSQHSFGRIVKLSENLCALSHCNHVQPSVTGLPGSSALGILQAKTLQWVAVSSSRGSSCPRDWTLSLMSPALAGGFFTISATWETRSCYNRAQLETLFNYQTLTRRYWDCVQTQLWPDSLQSQPDSLFTGFLAAFIRWGREVTSGRVQEAQDILGTLRKVELTQISLSISLYRDHRQSLMVFWAWLLSLKRF